MRGAFSIIEPGRCAAATRNPKGLLLGQTEAIVQANRSCATACTVLTRFTLDVIYRPISVWIVAVCSGQADKQRSAKQLDQSDSKRRAAWHFRGATGGKPEPQEDNKRVEDTDEKKGQEPLAQPCLVNDD